MKTHWKKSFDSPYIGSWDLEDYKDLTLTIKEAKSEKTKGLKEDSIKNILYFVEDYKPMIVNSGNSKVIKNLANSPYLEDWVGVKVTLYVKTVRAFGDNHDALRIREKTVLNELPELKPKTDNWSKVVSAIKNGYTIEQIKKKYKVSVSNEKILKIETSK